VARKSILFLFLGMVLAPACAAERASVQRTTDNVARVRTGWDEDPFPSTYKPYPGVSTLVKNVTIYDGEGGSIEHGMILFAEGKIAALGKIVEVPANAIMIDGTGKWITPGIIDIHSHMGAEASPMIEALSGANELTGPIHGDTWVEHSVWPQDPQFSRALTNGGVTTLEILPGSGNLVGGRSIVLKNVYATTVQGMKFPGAPYGVKMACGSNPMTVYGAKGVEPSTRMGDIAVDRQAWAKAVEYKRKWDAYERDGGTPPARDLSLDTLAGVLAGKMLIQNHCYRSDDMANFIDMSKEFGYHITTFHHAVEAYKIAPLLKANDICVAVFADQIGFKIEAVDGIPENLPLLWKAGVCVMIHSDSADTVQMLNQEVAKTLGAGRRMGITIPDPVAWEFLSYNPAKALGIADRTGSLKPGKMADIVLWNGNPFSSYSRPDKVWIDGALLFDAQNPRLRPKSDFELGQPGEGDTK
jgi:imidazolonepropionase-like amidohydrolase